MNRSTLFLGLVAAPLVLALSPGTARSVEPSDCGNLWLHEPLVVYDVSGATFTGPFDLSLSVYSSGQIKISSASSVPGEGRADIAFVGPAEARALAVELRALGAHTLCDSPASGADIPLKTLTVLGLGTDTFAHSFSWYTASGETAAIQQRLSQLISDTFPEF